MALAGRIKAALPDRRRADVAESCQQILAILAPHTVVEEEGLFPEMKDEFPDHISVSPSMQSSGSGSKPCAPRSPSPVPKSSTAVAMASSAAAPHDVGGRKSSDEGYDRRFAFVLY